MSFFLFMAGAGAVIALIAYFVSQRPAYDYAAIALFVVSMLFLGFGTGALP